VHISELAHRHVEAPAEVVSVGDPVNVKILDIEPKRRRISLSVKQTLEAPEGMEVAAPLSQEAFLSDSVTPSEEVAPEPEPEISPEPEAVAEEEKPATEEAEETEEEDESAKPPADTLEAFVEEMKRGS
jgi:small subunit ribosomal protein S1